MGLKFGRVDVSCAFQLIDAIRINNGDLTGKSRINTTAETKKKKRKKKKKKMQSSFVVLHTILNSKKRTNLMCSDLSVKFGVIQ